MSKPTLPPGTISHGTLLTSDLTKACYLALKGIGVFLHEHLSGCEVHGFYADNYCEECYLVFNEELMSLMNDYAPEGYYFGAHEGDGSDFGVWPIEDDE